MPQRIIFPQWPEENETTKYPFSSIASLTNGKDVILEGTFLDAALYVIGAGAGLRLSKVVVTNGDVTLYVGDPDNAELASGSFLVTAPTNSVSLFDAYGRPAGILVSDSIRLSALAGWGTGTHEFSIVQTEFCASVCIPTPEVGLRGIMLDDGTLLTGDVWLVGGDGVAITVTSAGSLPVIKVNIVGDNLYLRQACGDSALFKTPRFVTSITFDDGREVVTVTPDDNGDIKFLVNNSITADTVLRIHPTQDGNVVEVVGSKTK